jgi:hypothetical protein
MRRFCQQSEKGNYTGKENRQNRQPIRAITGLGVWNQKAQKCESDCKERNQN